MLDAMNDTKFLTIADVAILLGRSHEAIRRRIALGQLAAFRLGTGPKAPIRIAPSDLARHLQDVNERRERAGMRRPIPEALRDYVIARDQSRCHICGKRCLPEDIHLDHLIPFSLGGETTAANLRVAHASCNQSKKTRPMNEQLMVFG